MNAFKEMDEIILQLVLVVYHTIETLGSILFVKFFDALFYVSIVRDENNSNQQYCARELCIIMCYKLAIDKPPKLSQYDYQCVTVNDSVHCLHVRESLSATSERYLNNC